MSELQKGSSSSLSLDTATKAKGERRTGCRTGAVDQIRHEMKGQRRSEELLLHTDTRDREVVTIQRGEDGARLKKGREDEIWIPEVKTKKGKRKLFKRRCESVQTSSGGNRWRYQQPVVGWNVSSHSDENTTSLQSTPHVNFELMSI